MVKEHVVVLDIVSLNSKLLNDPELTPNLQRLMKKGKHTQIKPVFPAVTGSMQATYITGKNPSEHGIICNGLPDREYKEIEMWNQYMNPIEGEKLWEKLKKEDPDAETAILFWQFSKLTTADYVVTPSPIHLDGKMIQWYASKPRTLYPKLKEKYGAFDLSTFWGPLASYKSSVWIANAALDVLEEFKPRLSLVYLPNIDYHAQRFGPESEQSKHSVKEIDDLVGDFLKELDRRGLQDKTRLVILSEYNFKQVDRPIMINQILNENGYIATNRIENQDYLDLEMSRAFALADHQLTHVYVNNEEDIPAVKKLLEETPGVAEVWDEKEKIENHINHERAGELIAIAERDSWFVYYWWLDNENAPEFAFTVDIHRKPGYDPVELFVDPETYKIPLEPERIKGSHGLPPRGEEDLVSMIVTGNDIELPDQIDATDVHDILLELSLQKSKVKL